MTGESFFSSLSFFMPTNNVTRTLLIIQEDKTIPTNPKKLKVRKNEKNIIEIGPGRILTGIIKKISKNFNHFNFNNINDIYNLKNAIRSRE